MFIKGYDNNIPKLWKTSENLLRPLNGKKAYIVNLDAEKRSISTISNEPNPKKLSRSAKVLHYLFFLTILPPLFLWIARSAYRVKYDVDDKIKELKQKIVELSRKTLNQAPSPHINLIFDRNIGTFSFLDNAANQYKKLVAHQKWQSSAAKNFLYFELQHISEELRNLESDCIADHTLKPLVTGLKKQIHKIMVGLKPGKNPLPLKPEGIRNVGNSCYINAALQPLLALRDIRQLLPQQLQPYPKESEVDFKKRRKIYVAFTRLVQLHQKNANPKELGGQVAELRKRIFKMQLDQGGFINPALEDDMADAGSFFELLIYVVGWSIQEKAISIPLDEKNAAMPYQKMVSTPKSVIILNHKGSIQEAISKYSEPVISQAMGWKIKLPQQEMEVKAIQKQDISRIEGLPPSILVFRVENRAIDPHLDLRVDASTIFENVPATKDATYELVGFCQNHDHIHWTSVVKMETKWKYCDDSSVRTVNTQDADFLHPANYAVYRRVQI